MPGHFLHSLRASFADHAARPALIYRGETTSYAQLERRSLAAAAWLEDAGVEPGDRVALVIPAKLPFLIAQLGVLLAGAAPLPLNPRYTRDELRYFLSDSEASAVIAGSGEQPLVASVAAELPTPPKVLPDAAVVDLPAKTPREASVAAVDAALVMYSSGTTGWPKGVVHSHAGVAGNLRALAACWRMTADDTVVNALPLFHIHGLGFATHMTWLAGGAVRIEDTFDPLPMLEAIGQSSVFMAVPTMYYRLLEEPAFRATACDWQHARLFTCGSAPIRAEVLPELESILARPVINRYGMTEAFVITSLPLDGPWPNGSVGLPLSGMELRVLGDDGSPLRPGEVGSVAIRSANLFREYWRKPEATAAARVDGWFDTGDLGSLDAAGFLTLIGRKHDLIITSGYNVYPQVVERVVGECPGVRECAVLGVADSARGEAVAAAIVRAAADLDEASVQAWCAERLIHYQRPRRIAFVESLPRNGLGKVLRGELRKQFETGAAES